MDLKTLICTLVFIIIACSLNVVCNTSYKFYNSSSSWSSSSSSGSRYSVKGHRFRNISQSQPKFIYVKTNRRPITGQQSEWSSKGGLKSYSYRNITLNAIRNSIIINIPIHINGQLHAYVQPKEYYKIIPSNVLLSMRIAQRFRYNAIFILGYLLQSPNSGLNLQQYISLKIIYNALQRKQVQMYRLLPALIQLQGQTKATQLRILMLELSKYLPQYYSCSAAFWAAQVENNVFNPDAVLIKQEENFDLFANITETDIEIVLQNKANYEMGGYDQPSKLTETLIGRVFVKIFNLITVNRLILSQQLFAIILSNLPNPKGDVAFEEYVEFVAEIAWRNGIPNWEQKQSNPNCIEPYTLIVMMTERIVSDIYVSVDIKHALTYIKDHFVNQRNYVMTAHETYLIIERGGLDITFLLSIITAEQFSVEAVVLKNFLLEYSQTHYVAIQTVLRGMNKYGYSSTQELLLAFLMRLHLRLPDDQVEIRRIVTSLLLIVQVKVQVWHVTQVTPGQEVTTPKFGYSDRQTTTPAHQKPIALGDHRTTTPAYGKPIGPGDHRITTPAHKKPIALGDHRTTTPAYGKPIGPDDHRITTPAHGKPIGPDDHRTTTPAYGKPIGPGDHRTTTPAYGKPIGPGDHRTTTPAYGKPKGPGDHRITTPAHGKPIGPDDHRTTTPAYGKPIGPGDHRTTTPAYGKPIGPGDHRTTTPAHGKPISPGDHRTTTPAYGKPIGPGDHRITTPAHGKSTTYAYQINQTIITPKYEVTTQKPVPGQPTTTVSTTPSLMTPKKSPIVPAEVPELPLNVNPTQNIHITVTKVGVPSFVFTNETQKSEQVITVPSFVCLKKSPDAKDSQGECETDTEVYITTQLIDILGKDYIQQVLGTDWTKRHTTSITFLLALLAKAQDNPKVQKRQELLTIIKRYQVALKTVATYVFLPLIVQQRKIETKIVWSTFDYTHPSNSYIESYEPKKKENNTITLPLVNPKVWLLPVDVTRPFVDILPNLPPNSPYAQNLKPLIEIFTTEEIYNLLGTDWNASVYPNRGALFISVLRTLLTRETVKTNTKLYILVKNYLRAIELPAVYVHIPKTYMLTVVRQYNITIMNPGFPMELSEIKTLIPVTVNPEIKIQLIVSDRGVPSIHSLTTYKKQFGLKNVVSLPSVTCLQQPPMVGNPQNKCEKDVDVHVTQILTQTFGANYVQVILGNNWKELYSTRVSLLVALLEKVETHKKIVQQTESVKIIRRYKAALKSVATYIFLPLVVNYQKINSAVVWLTYDIKNPSIANIKTAPPYVVSNNTITLPLINPKSWVLPVDVMSPFLAFIPQFADANSSVAIQIQPLAGIIQTGEIYTLLGVDWETSQFPNRGALFVTALYTLLTVHQVKINTQLYTLLQQYLTAIELSSIHVHITRDFLKTATQQWEIDNQNIVSKFDPIFANVTKRNDILLPPLIHPNKDLQVTVKPSNRIFVGTSRIEQQISTDFLILPSVNCLQAFPDTNADEYCENFPHLAILTSVLNVLGNEETGRLLTDNSADETPTVAAFLENVFNKLLKNVKVAKEPQLVADIERYKMALEFATSTIFLPLLATYQKIVVDMIWLTYDTTNFRQSHMSLHRSEETGPNIVTLPLVNPKIWLQSVNIEHPFSSFIPNLPADDPYATKIQPLTDLFNSGEILQLLGSNWVPANYPNRGSLFISALRTLLNSKNVQSNKQLYTLVENYFNVIRVVALYVHIPRSWIKNEFEKDYMWNVDLVDLYTVLPAARTDYERQHFYRLQAFLHTQNLLQLLQIRLSASSTYKIDLLIKIITRTLKSKRLEMNANLKETLRYYQNRTELALVARSGVVRWTWVPRVMSVNKAKTTLGIDIGKIFVVTIPLSKLKTKESKVHYFKLIKYMNDNPSFLKTTKFMFSRYPDYGQFLRAYLNYLMNRRNTDEKVKMYINTVLPYIRNHGPGSTLINVPNLRKSDIR